MHYSGGCLHKSQSEDTQQGHLCFLRHSQADEDPKREDQSQEVGEKGDATSSHGERLLVEAVPVLLVVPNVRHRVTDEDDAEEYGNH